MSNSAVGPNKAGFVFEEAKDGGPNKILAAVPVKTFLTQYTDGAGKKCVRMVFQPEKSENYFILQEKIGGTNVATAATQWFNKNFSAKLKELNLVDRGNTGVEGAESV